MALARLAQAHAQLEAKRESGEYRGLAQSWMRSVEVAELETMEVV